MPRGVFSILLAVLAVSVNAQLPYSCDLVSPITTTGAAATTAAGATTPPLFTTTTTSSSGFFSISFGTNPVRNYYVLNAPTSFQIGEDFCYQQGGYIYELFYNNQSYYDAVAIKKKYTNMDNTWIGLWNVERATTNTSVQQYHWIYENLNALQDTAWYSYATSKVFVTGPLQTTGQRYCGYLNSLNQLYWDSCTGSHYVICAIHPLSQGSGLTTTTGTGPTTPTSLTTTNTNAGGSSIPATSVHQKCYEAASAGGIIPNTTGVSYGTFYQAVAYCEDQDSQLPFMATDGDWTAYTIYMNASNLTTSWLGMTVLQPLNIGTDWYAIPDYGFVANYTPAGTRWQNTQYLQADMSQGATGCNTSVQIGWQIASGGACSQLCAASTMGFHGTMVAMQVSCDSQTYPIVCQKDFTRLPSWPIELIAGGAIEGYGEPLPELVAYDYTMY